MRSISERDLAVVIPLLASKIRDFTLELRADAGQVLGESEREERYQTEETLQQYEQILDSLREEYEEGLAEGIALPKYADLVRAFVVEPG